MSKQEKYYDFEEWENAVFKAGATQVLEVGENIFYAIRTPDNKPVQTDADGMFDLRSRRGREIMKNAVTIGGWAGGIGEVYRHLVARAGKARPYENPRTKRESPLYVKYLSLKSDEEPFMMGGTKYEYVWAEYPGGIKDIGVYSYANDLVYSYDAFRQMMNLPNPLKRRKGETQREFMSRCMSEEHASFPMQKQRVAVCLSKSRRRNPVYDTGSDE